MAIVCAPALRGLCVIQTQQHTGFGLMVGANEREMTLSTIGRQFSVEISSKQKT